MSNQKGRINVSVANLYRESTYRSEIVNQGLLGELISIKKKDKDFSQVEFIDGYSGWLSNHQWVLDSKHSHPMKTVRKHFETIYQKPDTRSEPIRDVTIGSKVSVINEIAEWFEIVLPDDLTGWIKKETFTDFPACSREGVVQFVKEFIGYPYYWGGRSPKGFDCSGLMQSVFSLIDVALPRDSWMQHQQGKYISDRPENAQAGDLYFFAEDGKKITHVGMAVGNIGIIHSRGFVRRNSLDKKSTDYSEDLYNSFVDVRTFF